MKKITTIFVLLLTVLLAACSNNKITAKAIIELDADNTNLSSIYFNLAITDPDKQITGQVEVRLYDKDNKLVPNKNLTVDGDDYSGIFANLPEATKYSIQVYAAIGRKMVKIGSLDASTRSSQTKTIETTEQFLKMSEDFRANYELMNDLDFTGVDFKTIFNLSTQAFQGTFDGKNHKISNIKFSGITSATSIFGFVSYGKIKNLVIENFELGTSETPFSIASSSRIAVVASRISSTEGLISNVTIKNAEIHFSSSAVGSQTTAAVQAGMVVGELLGVVEDVVIENSNLSIEGKRHGRILIGGVAGKTGESAVVKRANVDVNITYKLNSTTSSREDYTTLIGGIVGDSASTRINGIQNVIQQGDIAISELNYNTRESTVAKTYSLFIGGIVGQSLTQITNAIYAGSISFTHEKGEFEDETIVKKFYIGGIAGFYNSNRSITGALRYGIDQTITILDDSLSSTFSQTIARLQGTANHFSAVYNEAHLSYNGESKTDDDLATVINSIDDFLTSDWIKAEFAKLNE